MKTLIATEKPFAPPSVLEIKKKAEELGEELVWLERYTNPAELLNAMKDVDALVIRSDKVTVNVLDAGNKLKVVVRAGAGYDNVDCEHAKKKDIVVMNTPGRNSNAVAEAVIGFAIYISRGQFTGRPGTELGEKVIGLHGFGYVGKAVVPLAKGFGMKILAHDPFLAEEEFKNLGVESVSLDELYKRSDFISLHLPGGSETKKLINYDLMSKLPGHAAILNAARPTIIDEDDLLKIMKEKPDMKFISDVPLVSDEIKNAILDLKDGKFRFFVTGKKMGAGSVEANTNAGCAAVEQIHNFFEKGDKTFQGNSARFTLQYSF